MKPFDFIRTESGSIGMVTETNHEGKEGVVHFIWKLPGIEKNAWWKNEELEIIGNLSHLIASTMRHPFGGGQEDVDKFFGLKKSK